jgi:photosystem II stability/assembly factor-like uncharacterized protein
MRPIGVIIAALLASVHLAAQIPSSLFDGLRWRMIGPFRGGRAVTASGVAGDPATFYFGAVGGGIWKTTNGGTSWTPIFDRESTASVGALEVAPSNPNVIYAGTGEADIRSDLGSGNGVYKSIDAGRAWTHIGLDETRQIGRIAVHPTNPDIVYVAALGHAYGPNQERGVFRSTDGGRTWQKVLYKGPNIGATDLAIDPENPQVIYATLWQAQRPPWSTYGPMEGPGGGLYKSMDGGDHWTQLTGNGLPQGPWHRAAVAVAHGNQGRRVYALIDAVAATGLFRSDDAGRSWTQVSNDARIDSRAWYFSSITVDPKDPDTLYIPNVAIYRSTDGGRNFTVLKGAPGGDDYHFLWIDPTAPSRMIQASDQGVSISLDRGNTWSSWYNQPTAQLYHVITDNQFPYHVYASQQDSGTVALASRTDHGHILEYDRWSVGGAESGYIAQDAANPNIFYVGNTYGSLDRFDKRTTQGQNITPWPLAAGGDISQRKYRFPWTAPLVVSPMDHALYYGSQYVMKTVDGGLTWHELSPDLTGAVRGNSAPAGEPTIESAKQRGYGVVYTIAPSPLGAEQIWAGSDTGLIHLTRDGGKTWSNVTPKGLSDWSKITHIEASHFAAGEAYAAVDRHRLDDNKPYLFRTRDFGKTWTAITSGIGPTSFLNAVREDPARRGLLYAATETAVYVSFDDGDHWQSLQLNMPAVSVRDLVIHGDDLVIATHGRSFWILDDISPLRQANAQAAASDVWLFKPTTAIRLNSEAFLGTPFPPETPQAENPPDGAILDHYLKPAAAGEVTLEILDSKNEVVRRFSSSDKPVQSRRRLAIADYWIEPPQSLGARAGMSRGVWDLRYPSAFPEAGGGGEGGPPGRGPLVLPGTYQVRLTAAGHQLTQPLKVVMDPRSTATPTDLAKQFDLAFKAWRDLKKTSDTRGQLTALRRRLAEIKSSANTAQVSLASEVDTEAARILGGSGGRGASATPSGLGAAQTQLNAALSVAESADRTPPAAAYTLYEQGSRGLTAQLAAWEALKNGKLAELNRALRAASLPEIDLAAAAQ